MLNTTCRPTGAAGRSWGVAASGGTSIGHKGMLYAAKVMAMAAAELARDPEKLTTGQEFDAHMAQETYTCPIPDHVKPPQFKNPMRLRQAMALLRTFLVAAVSQIRRAAACADDIRRFEVAI